MTEVRLPEPQDFQFVLNEDVLNAIPLPEVENPAPSDPELARRYTAGVMCARAFNKGKKIWQSRPLPKFKADLFAKSDWFCMACSKSAAANEKENRKGGTRTFQLKFFDDGLIIGSAVCRTCARHARNIGRSGPLKNIKNEKDLMHLYANFKNTVLGEAITYPNCMPVPVDQAPAPLEELGNYDGFLTELNTKISELGEEVRVRKHHHHHKHRDRSPKRPAPIPEAKSKWTPEELETLITEIRDGPEIPGTTKGKRINALRMEHHGFGTVLPPSPPKKREPEVVVPVELRRSLSRPKKQQCMEKLVELHKIDYDTKQRISDFNDGWKEISKKQKSGPVTDAPVPVPVVVKSAEPPAIVKSILGMIKTPVEGESLVDVSLWRDMIPELRKCKAEDWVYFQDTAPEVWNIFWIVKKFRFLSLSDMSAMATGLYKYSRDLLMNVRPNLNGAPLVIDEVNRVQTLCLSYINCVLEGQDLLPLGHALERVIRKLCGVTDETKKMVDHTHLCHQLRQLLLSDKQMGIGFSMAKLVKLKV